MTLEQAGRCASKVAEAATKAGCTPEEIRATCVLLAASMLENASAKMDTSQAVECFRANLIVKSLLEAL